MCRAVANGEPAGRLPLEAVLLRVIDNFLRLFPRFLARHDLAAVKIAVQFHNRGMVRVTLTSSTVFPASEGSAGTGETTPPMPGGEPARSRAQPLTPDELNALIRLRLQRLLWPLRFSFGTLEIEAAGGMITVRPAPSFREEELESLSQLLAEICKQAPGCASAAGDAVPAPAMCRTMRLLKRRTLNHRGHNTTVS